MILLRCRVRGFGKLSGLELCFGEGMNLVVAPNEAGKTTLQHFLLGMIYGQYRGDLKHQRRMDGWVELYRPWSGGEFGGTLWCRAEGGRELELRREFGRDADRIEIRTAGGEEITGRYERQKNGEVLFARHHLGMPKELFESVAFIRENRISELPGAQSIKDRILNLAQTGDEDLSVRRIIGGLEAVLDGIGSERAPTRPLRQAQDRIEALKAERKVLEERRQTYRSWVEERGALAREIDDQERELAAAQQRIRFVHSQETERNLRILERMESELTVIRAEIASCPIDATFPAEQQDELIRLAGAKKILDTQEEEIRRRLETEVYDLEIKRSEREPLAVFEFIEKEDIGERLTGNLARLQGLNRQQENTASTLAAIQQEMQSCAKAHSELDPIFQTPDLDWQAKARMMLDAERVFSEKEASLGEELEKKREALVRLRRDITGRVLLGSLAFALGVAAVLSVRLKVDFAPQGWYGYAGFALLSVCALSLYFGAARAQRNADYVRQAILGLEIILAEDRRKVREGHREIQEAMTGAGFQSLQEFLAAAQESERLRQRIDDLTERASREERHLAAIGIEEKGLEAEIHECLERAGVGSDGEALDRKVEKLREGLRLFRAAHNAYEHQRQKVESLRLEQRRVLERRDKEAGRIGEILEGARVESVEAFDEGCRLLEGLRRLQERDASLTREFDRLRAGLSVEEWRARNDALKAQLEGVSVPDTSRLTQEEALRDEREAAARLSSLRQEQARVSERVQQAFHHYRTLSEIEEDLSLAQSRLQELETDRAALVIARDILQELSREQQELLGPRLNEAVGKRFERLSQGRYPQVKIDPDLRMHVRELESGELRMVDSLSRGTKDQLYFALRFGVLDLLSSEKEPVPCLLDEPLAAYDRARMSEMFDLLEQEGERRQVLLFSCREDVREMALLRSMRLVTLPGP